MHFRHFGSCPRFHFSTEGAAPSVKSACSSSHASSALAPSSRQHQLPYTSCFGLQLSCSATPHDRVNKQCSSREDCITPSSLLLYTCHQMMMPSCLYLSLKVKSVTVPENGESRLAKNTGAKTDFQGKRFFKLKQTPSLH